MRRAFVAAACLASALAGAATFRVDDSQTLPSESTTTMKWRSLAPGRVEGNAVESSLVLTIRLNLQPWMNRNGRVYMVLPVQAIGPISAEWTTQGKLLPGTLVSGNRALVYSGPIRTALLEDTVVLRLAADGRRLVATERLQFHFEIDVD